MGLYTASHEATTFISVDRVNDIGAALEGHRLDLDACLSLTEVLRDQGIMASPIHSIVEAYATGEPDDLSDGELKTFVRFSFLVEAVDLDHADNIVPTSTLLQAIYDRLSMPNDVEGDFEFTGAEEAELFTMPDEDGQIAYLSHLETLKTETAPKL